MSELQNITCEYPKQIYICSENGILANSISKSLCLFIGADCHVISDSQPDKIADEILTNSLDSFGVSEATCILHYDSHSSDIIPRCINTVVTLRNRRHQWGKGYSYWIGGLLAIMPSESHFEELASSTLLGEKMGLRFGDMFCNQEVHACISMPLSLPELLRAIISLGTFHRYSWDAYIAKCPLLVLHDNIESKLANIEKRQINESDLYDVHLEIKESFQKINWEATLAHEMTTTQVKELMKLPTPNNISQLLDYTRKANLILKKVLLLKGIKGGE